MSCRKLTYWPQLRRGEPVLDRALMANHRPEVGEMYDGRKRVLSPDFPYAAACARNAIYFIDQRYDLESAKHIKEQLEHLLPDQNGHYFIDEVEATAERKDVSGKTLFTWNPAYARVLFADSMNEKNPSLKIPVHEPAGEWMVVYDLRNATVGGKAEPIGTGLDPRDSGTSWLFKNGQGDGPQSVAGDCASGSSEVFEAAVDTPRFEGESDADYYQRMDKLHFG